MANKFNLLAKAKAVLELRKSLPIKLANLALNHSIQSFRDGGWTDQSLERWKPRQKPDAGRAILVSSGDLRRSLKVTATAVGAKVSSDLPYAETHNAGLRRGRSYMPKRKFLGKSKKLDAQMKKKILDELNKAMGA